jgi:hypothetical protein
MSEKFQFQYCDIEQIDIVEFWEEIEKERPIPIRAIRSTRQNTNVYLLGWYEGNGRTGMITGETPKLDNSDKVIFPVINAKYEDANVARKMIDHTDGSYAFVYRDGYSYEIDLIERKRIIFESGDQNYDGFWVCLNANSLYDKDGIAFGASGPVSEQVNYEDGKIGQRFETKSFYFIHK